MSTDTNWVIVRQTANGISVSRNMRETTARSILRTLPAAMRQEGLEDTWLTPEGLTLLDRTTGVRVAWAIPILDDGDDGHVDELLELDAIEQTRRVIAEQNATRRGIEAVLALIIVACVLLWLVR